MPRFAVKVAVLVVAGVGVCRAARMSILPTDGRTRTHNQTTPLYAPELNILMLSYDQSASTLSYDVQYNL